MIIRILDENIRRTPEDNYRTMVVTPGRRQKRIRRQEIEGRRQVYKIERRQGDRWRTQRGHIGDM